MLSCSSRIEQALEAADPDVRVAEPDEHRRAGRRGLVAAHQLLAGLDQAEGLRRVDAERLQHLGGEDLAHAAFQRQPAVGGARPGRAAAALGAEIEQPAVLEVVHLREQEAAPVAELGIVAAELVAVIAQRQRLVESCRAAARSGRNGRSIPRPSARPGPTRSAQRWLRKRRMCCGNSAGRDLVVEVAAELRMAGRRAEAGRYWHQELFIAIAAQRTMPRAATGQICSTTPSRRP